MSILDRYATAINATNLKSEPRTCQSDSDVIGAAGLAAKYEPIGIALARFLSGGSPSGAIEAMASAVHERGFKIKCRVTEGEAVAIATAVLAWYRHGACKPCNGTGFNKIKDTPALGGECRHCRGTGRVPFDSQFRYEWKPLARWLAGQIEMSQAAAGVVAMKKLASAMDL